MKRKKRWRKKITTSKVKLRKWKSVRYSAPRRTAIGKPFWCRNRTGLRVRAEAEAEAEVTGEGKAHVSHTPEGLTLSLIRKRKADLLGRVIFHPDPNLCRSGEAWGMSPELGVGPAGTG